VIYHRPNPLLWYTTEYNRASQDLCVSIVSLAQYYACVCIYTHSTVEVDQKSSKLDKNRYCSKFMYNVYSQMLTTVSLRLCPYKYKRSWGGGFQRNFKSALQTSATNTDQLFKCWAESSLAAEAIGTKPSNITLTYIYMVPLSYTLSVSGPIFLWDWCGMDHHCSVLSNNKARHHVHCSVWHTAVRTTWERSNDTLYMGCTQRAQFFSNTLWCGIKEAHENLKHKNFFQGICGIIIINIWFINVIMNLCFEVSLLM